MPRGDYETSNPSRPISIDFDGSSLGRRYGEHARYDEFFFSRRLPKDLQDQPTRGYLLLGGVASMFGMARRHEIRRGPNRNTHVSSYAGSCLESATTVCRCIARMALQRIDRCPTGRDAHLGGAGCRYRGQSNRCEWRQTGGSNPISGDPNRFVDRKTHRDTAFIDHQPYDHGGL